MPLRDHFRPPVEKRHSWDELHGGWPMVIVQKFFPQLPSGFVAVPNVHLGSSFEIDVSAYELTGDAKYADWHQQVHNWSHKYFADPEHGEWFGYLHRDGRVSTFTKGNLWKSFFHYPRMQWLCSEILNR